MCRPHHCLGRDAYASGPEILRRLLLTSGRTGHWTKMHQSLVKFSESEASNHAPSLADFTTTTPELKFSVLTREDKSIVIEALEADGPVSSAHGGFRDAFRSEEHTSELQSH